MGYGYDTQVTFWAQRTGRIQERQRGVTERPGIYSALVAYDTYEIQMN